MNATDGATMRHIIQIEPILMQSFVFFIFLTVTLQVQGQTWSEDSTNQHILISTSTVAGKYQINAKMIVNATPLAFFNLLENTPIDCSWIANCKSVTVLDQSLPDYRFVHTVFNSPWPVADREMYTRSHHVFSADMQHLSIMIEDISAQYPTHPKNVMMKAVQAQWSMTHSHDDWYELNYLASADPGGNIPQWLSQRLLKDSTFTTLKQLRAILHAQHSQ